MLNVAKEVAVLNRLTTKDLRRRFAEVFGEATTANNKPWLIKRIIWRLQALAEGGLSERAKQRAIELARDADLRLLPPRGAEAAIDVAPLPRITDRRLPAPGTVITREYKGRTLRVTVTTDGFIFEGEKYPSLSRVAKAITGSHCNGFHFFRLGTGGNQ